MGINSLVRIFGTLTFSQHWVMLILFLAFYTALAVLSVSRPVAAVVMYFGTSIMNPSMSYPTLMDIPLGKVSAVLCLAVCLVNAPRLSFRFSWLLLPMVGFLVMANIATMTALTPALADRRFEEFNKIGLMVFLTLWAVGDRKDYTFMFWGILGSFAYGVLKNLVETQTLEAWVAIKGSYGWIGDSNDWALALAMALPLFYSALALNWNRGWKIRFMLGVAACGALLTLTLTYSRGGFLAFLVSGIVFLVMDRKPWRALLVGAAIAVVVAIYMPNSYVDKVKTIFGLESQAAAAWDKELDDDAEYTGAERAYFWRVAYEIMMDHPAAGVGWGNFIKEFERREGLKEGVVAHSTWFQVGAESGVTGLVLYVLMVLSTLLNSFLVWLKSRRVNDVWGELHSRAVFAGMIAFCVGGTFLSRENSELVFIYIAMSAILSGLVSREAEAASQASAVRTAQPCPAC